MNRKRTIAGLLIIGVVTALSAFITIDDDPISKIIARLDKWLQDHPQEKVYLQLDKPYYAAGDDVWFKAYIVAGGRHRLSAISGVLNVELIDELDSIKQSVKLPVVNGLTWGDFALPDTLKDGNYHIRAYTNWMRNAGEAYFFDKTFAVVNSITNKVFTKTVYTYSTRDGRPNVEAVINYTDLNGAPYAGNQVSYTVNLGSRIVTRGKGLTDANGNLTLSFANTNPQLLNTGRIVTELRLADKRTITKSILVKAASGKTDIQFFPEGGNLVYGNESKIAFKAVGADGLGVDIKGTVLDDKNNPVTTFTAMHLGMGVFNIKPESGRTYKAQVIYPDGSSNTIDLPAPVNTGYTLNISNVSDNIIVKILPGPDVTKAPSETGAMSLVAQSGGIIYYAGKSQPGSKFFRVIIPGHKFPAGIVQFTLFSAAGEPMNERLVFVENPDQLKLGISSENQSYSPRQKVKIAIDAKDPGDKPVQGSFSVSVTNETTVPVDEAAEGSILSNLLLTSDVRGYIEQPGYYFTSPGEKTTAALDVLMLTQGYHRFEWKQVLGDNYPADIYQAEKTLGVSGHLKTLSGKPVANGKVTLFTNSRGFFLIDTTSDNTGRFSFNNLVFGDSVKFVVQARTAKDRKNLHIDLDNITPPSTAKNRNAPGMLVNISDGLSPFLQNSAGWYAGQLKYGLIDHAQILKEVKITAKKNPAEHSANLNGPGSADQIVSGYQIAGMGCVQLADCLQGKLAGVRFMNGKPYLAGGFRAAPMTIIIDGVNVEADILNDLNASDIESIEVLRSIGYTAIYGARGGSGVLIITTKRGESNYEVRRYAPGVVTYSPKGYYKVRAFYSPRYDDPKTNVSVPDLRSTIYWNPNIVTDKDGKASFDYFNADTKGTYRMVIEGIDADGNLGRKVYRYKVE
jgi:hypothetical protein